MKGIFCKINIGEGKLTIIQFFAAYKVLLGNKVYIVCISPIYAERDAKDIIKKYFYNNLNIKVGAATEEKIYSLDIVYGDIIQFSSDILLQDYEFIKRRGKRGYDVVIIDEVDRMCIDYIGAKIQLTKRISGYQSFYTFYYLIIYAFTLIAFEMNLTKNRKDIEDKRDIIKNQVLLRLMGNSFYLDNGEEKKNIKKAIPKLITKDKDGKIKLFEIDGKNTFGILYPNCLKEKIENWIDSVITSFSMVENMDYRIVSNKEKYKRVVPADFCYGSNIWNEALHQILQIINDAEIFPENINTNFLLLISFFKKYKELYGLTGDIGSKFNQETLQNLYNVEFYFIPPNFEILLNKRSELFFSDEKKWQSKIINEIKEIFLENRSVLLVCSSINDGEKFANILKKNGIFNIKKYFIEKHKNAVEEVLEQKYVIIASNIARDGVYIKLSKNLQEVGGLHVILSYIPINQRFEEQIYRKAIISGKKGSYSLIFMYNSDNPNLTVESIKKKREAVEKEKVEFF